MLINPGGGGSSADTAALNEEATVFRDFHRTGDYKPIRSYFERCLARRDKWLWRYRELFGLDHDEIAQLNIAWCATENNIYPSSMQDRCFERHTAALLRALDPHVVILSGGVSRTGSESHPYEHPFAGRIQALLPRAKVVPTIHYANRGSRFAKEEEARRVAKLIQSAST